MKGKRQIVGTALLKVKCFDHTLNPENVAFEDFVSSSRTSIKIDLLDGRSLMEKGFRSHEVPIERFYVEFFDTYPIENMMDYLTNPQSDFRVTSMDGTVIRMSHHDYDMIPNIIKNDESNQPLKEYVFQKEKKGFFQKLRRVIRKKDN